MQRVILRALAMALVAAISYGFTLQFAPVRQNIRTVSMRAKPQNAHCNLSRKLKRKLRSADATSFSQLYTPEFDEFLKVKASPGIYNSIYPKIQKIARQLNVVLNPDFGVRPKIVRPDMVETAASLNSIETFVKIINASGIADTLRESLLTMFAPTDEAFSKLGEQALEELMKDIPKLQSLLKNHMMDGSNSSKKIAALNGKQITSMLGTDFPVKVGKQDNVITIGAAKLLSSSETKCRNGIIHIIDTVLMPTQ